MSLKRKRTNPASKLSTKKEAGSSKDARDDPEFELEAPAFSISIKGNKQTPLKRKRQKAEWKSDIIDKIIIQPKAQWDKMPKYGTFVHGNVNFKVGDIVEIKRPEDDDETSGPRKEWFAKVQDVRAESSAKVFLRIAWFYWPEDLPGGRMEYHGRNELVESNHPDIVDATTVNSKPDIKEWDESDEDVTFDGYYYRQQFDYLSKQLTTPREFCVCQGYYNPDTRIVNCPKCRIWMHEECITADAIKRRRNLSLAASTISGVKSEPNDEVIAVFTDDDKDDEGSREPKTPDPKPNQTIRAILFGNQIRIQEHVKKEDNDSDSGLDADTIIDEEICCLECGEIVV
ncbi:hypothetical protein TWF481_007245 [Arthrobotrys musiformis]|uniref:BAH domain-containing protein n=1 Tax=Arthrobotrys musiformis TaxID=47236 RepID=A0AAV9WBV4_9PEZI